MHFPGSRILLLPNFEKKRSAEVLQDMVQLLPELNLKALALEEDRNRLSLNGTPEESFAGFLTEVSSETCDLICVIGGDGTLLRYARLAARSGVPITGINTGKLGFLTPIDPENIRQYMEYYRTCSYDLDHRISLQVSWPGGSRGFVLNDLVLSGFVRSGMVYFSVFCDGRLIERYRADALIASTPTGSTAYSLSAGGAVQEASLATVSFQAICAQLGLKIPLVFSAAHRFTFTCSEDVQIICDGDLCGTLKRGEAAEMKQTTLLTTTLNFHHTPIFPGFRKKLEALEDRLIED